jgi:hypothetical protein
MSGTNRDKLIRRIRTWLCIFVFFLVLSGLTAFPLNWELELLNDTIGEGTTIERTFPHLSQWITKVYTGLKETDQKYPFIAYGTDWLAFAHIVIAIAFIGPIRDPVKNVWVVEFGIIACILVIPLAMICGPIREIPFYWRLIDCSFGVLGIIPLLIVRKDIRTLERNARKSVKIHGHQ